MSAGLPKSGDDTWLPYMYCSLFSRLSTTSSSRYHSWWKLGREMNPSSPNKILQLFNGCTKQWISVNRFMNFKNANPMQFIQKELIQTELVISDRTPTYCFVVVEVWRHYAGFAAKTASPQVRRKACSSQPLPDLMHLVEYLEFRWIASMILFDLDM